MKIVKAECQKCHAPLEVDLDNLISTCPYCGGQYIIESDQLSYVLGEKEKTKRYEIQQKAEIIKHKYHFFSENKTVLFVVLGIIFFCIVMICADYFDPDTALTRKLNRIDAKINSYLDSHQYDKALSEVNKLDEYQSLTFWEKDEKKMWKEKQEKYLESIPKMKREYDLSNPDNILAPISSKKATGKTIDEVLSLFQRAGFTKIKTIMVEGGGGLFKKPNRVQRIVFGDKSEFSTDDYMNKNGQILIYYYSK